MSLLKPLILVSTMAAFALAGCVTDPTTGQQKVSKTALYGLGGATVCGIAGAITHGSRGARNSALACGAIGAGIGGYMDYQEKLLRERLANTNIEVEREGNQIKLVMPENITFATNSASLSSAATSSLSSVAQVVAKYVDTTINVAGYTDSSGNDSINIPLSQRRAQSVADYLISNGVTSSRISANGYGAANPVASNATSQGKAQNRRVEIRINPVKTSTAQ